MASILALLSSILWGTADYLAGNMTKRFKAIAVTGVSQAFGLITGIVLVVATGSYIAPNLSWDGYLLPAAGAGIAGFFGLVSFYSGLATGRMGVVSPLSTMSAVIPLTFAFISGERPTGIQILGMSIALLGAFCASGPDIVSGLPIKPLLYGLGAALGFGIALTLMAQGSKTSSLMTMTSMRVISVSMCILIALRFRTVGGFRLSDLWLLVVIGMTDFAANLLLGVATTKGLVSVAMVFGALFPIVTSLLAFKFLKERLHKVQYLGIFFAVAGVSLISIG
ncbi:MAG: DMT family transporter [Actinobacteria bacterium]|nr:DMT family transporter [Actinomycetota bacterium]MDA2996404.1 DMT family transporter [Actinomycetota bacterium]